MYSYIWDKGTHGYLLTTQTGRFVANEIRPVFVEELFLVGLDKFFEFDVNEKRPLLWAQKNTYLYNGDKVAQLNGTQFGKDLSQEVFFEGILKIEATDIESMVRKNAEIMDYVIADAKRRAKELYDKDMGRCDLSYIAFSGGKDSVVLLDICHRVLPLSVPVIFSDTDMELPDTYAVWEDVQKRYSDREFICTKADTVALKNWELFGPPSRSIRWCCSVHKSTPALTIIKSRLKKTSVRAMAFVGVRGDESFSRSFYEDSADGAKNASQLNRMPILDWGAHELWLYIFENELIINPAYKKGLSRVGCVMCPEASEKYEWYVDKIYPGLLTPYSEIIISTSAKVFTSDDEKNEYVGKRFWQARRSGSVLKDPVTAPHKQVEELTVSYQCLHFKKEMFLEWIKTIGTVSMDRISKMIYLKQKNTLGQGIAINYKTNDLVGDVVSFAFNNCDEKKAMLPFIDAALKKVACCINCRSCEVECPVGAIYVEKDTLKIDETKCNGCKKCYNIDNSCWRYKSMYKPENTKSILNAIAGYRNFGLRERWVDVLCEMEERFFPWDTRHPLGKDMVESAKRWFPQAYLFSAATKKPTRLVELFKRFGSSNALGWELIWMALANNSSLVKWYIVSTSLDMRIETQELSEIMKKTYPLNGNVKDRRLDPLKNMAIESPLGAGKLVIIPETKGKAVLSLTRKDKEVNPLTILFGLYLIAHATERGSFTIRELLTADEESAYVSPLVAFGITPDTFKKQCEGLKSRYPNYIETVFTHGNDELTVFPNQYVLEDIITLAMEG